MTDEHRRALEESALKRAMGYESVETQEEYSLVDGEFSLVKRKVVRKDVAPDLGAIKWLLGESERDDVSIEELAREREELLREYAAITKQIKTGGIDVNGTCGHQMQNSVRDGGVQESCEQDG